VPRPRNIPAPKPFEHRVSDERWAQYFAYLKSGLTKHKAAHEAGIAYESVQRLHRGDVPKSGGVKFLQAYLADHTPDVIKQTGMARAAKAALTDFGLFRSRYFGRLATPWQEQAAHRMVDLLGSDNKEYVVVNCPPGSGKSTLFTHDIPAWVQCRNRATRIMIGSRTETQAKMYTARLRRSYERRTPVEADPILAGMGLSVNAEATLIHDYGRFKPLRNDLWRAEEFVIAQPGDNAVEDKEPSVMAAGMDTGFLGGRFNMVIWDDLVDRRTTRTAEMRQNLISWWETEAETRLEPGGLLILQGQRIAAEDLYRYALDLRDILDTDLEADLDKIGVDGPRKYHHIVYKAHDEEKCKGKETHRKDAPFWPKGCLLDPQRLRWMDLVKLQVNSSERYRVLYQQEDVDPAAALIRSVWIRGGQDADGTTAPGCLDEHRRLGEVPRNLAGDVYSVISADPSPTKYWAVSWWMWQREPQFGTVYHHLCDLYRGSMDAADFLDWHQATGSFSGLLEEWWQRARDLGHPVGHVIVEINAAQRFLLQHDHVRRWQIARTVQITPHSTAKNKSDPEFGVQTLAPLYKFGQVRLPGHPDTYPRVAHMIRELTTWPEGTYDDTVMSHWFVRANEENLFIPRNVKPPTFQRPTWLRQRSRGVA